MNPLPQKNNRNNETEMHPYTHIFLASSGMGQDVDRTESECAGLCLEQTYFLGCSEDISIQENRNKASITVLWYPPSMKKEINVYINIYI